MKAQRKTWSTSETNTKRPSHCSPDDSDDPFHPAAKYSPGVLVGEWQKAAEMKREDEKWLQYRDCGRCADLRGAHCTWRPDVILRRTVRNGGYLYDRPPVLVCQDRGPDDDCRLFHRRQLKSLYDQHYNEHPATQPAHVDCPDLLPEGPTNFGLLDKMTVKWQDDIGGLVALRTGPSLYRESYQRKTRDTGAKYMHSGCENYFKNDSPKADKPVPVSCDLAEFCEPCTSFDTSEKTRAEDLSIFSNQSSTSDSGQCENSGNLWTSDTHSTAPDHFNGCENNNSNYRPTAPRAAVRKNAAERGCKPHSSVKAFESENQKINAGNKLSSQNQTKRPQRELFDGNVDPQFEFRQANVTECDYSRWNVPESEIPRKEVGEWEFPKGNFCESEYGSRNLQDCDRPGNQALPSRPARDAEHGMKSGCTRMAFPKIGSTGTSVHGSGLDPEIDQKSEREGRRYVPPTPGRFFTALSRSQEACHSCLNPSVV